MRSILTVTTPAANRALLTIDELRAAAGVSGGSQDPSLQAMGLRIADAIASECNVAVGAASPPTLLRESLIETFFGVSCAELVLSRRHDVVIDNIIIDGEPLSGYIVNPESAMVMRLCSDVPVNWSASKIVVNYAAGFSEVPGDLKQAAIEFFRLSWSEQRRDLAVKSERIDVQDVEEREITYWAGALPGVGNSPVPSSISGNLARYRNVWIS